MLTDTHQHELRCHRSPRGVCCGVLLQRYISHTHDHHIVPQAIVRHHRAVDTLSRFKALALVLGSGCRVWRSLACRAQAQNRQIAGVGLREIGDHPLVQLGLFGCTGLVLFAGRSIVNTSLLQLLICDLVQIAHQPHTNVDHFPECWNLENSPGQPWTISHLSHERPNCLQILRAQLLLSTRLLGLLGGLVQLPKGRFQVLELLLLGHQLHLCFPHNLNTLGALGVQGRHSCCTLLLDRRLAGVIVTRGTGLFNKILDDQKALPPSFLQLLPLCFALLG
mmetsp:Transcript_26107/g.62975  ORF Transcript_26107/g.62975 Transcript_26107/m.62975 type:complete len:279 (-) Transcript_26107:893-1729(-)